VTICPLSPRYADAPDGPRPELVDATDRFEARLRQLDVVGRSGSTMDRIIHEHPEVRPLFEDA
jgi:hypothetical protein